MYKFEKELNEHNVIRFKYILPTSLGAQQSRRMCTNREIKTDEWIEMECKSEIDR